MPRKRQGRLAKAWDWTLQLTIPAAIIIGGYGIWDANSTAHALVTQQSHFHSASIAKQNVIIELQKRNHELGLSNHALAEKYVSGVMTLTKDGSLVYQQNAAICAAFHISPCPGAP